MGERRSAYWVLVGKSQGWSHLEDPGVDGKMILKWVFDKWYGGLVMDWISLAEDRDIWRAAVNAVMNHRVP